MLPVDEDAGDKPARMHVSISFLELDPETVKMKRQTCKGSCLSVVTLATTRKQADGARKRSPCTSDSTSYSDPRCGADGAL